MSKILNKNYKKYIIQDVIGFGYYDSISGQFRGYNYASKYSVKSIAIAKAYEINHPVKIITIYI